MLNPLKWKLKTLKQVCSPTGPDFNAAFPISINLSGTEVLLRLPCPSHSKFGSSLLPESKYDIYHNAQYYTEVDTPNLPRLNLLHYRWAFYGPAFTGGIAELSCVIAVMAPKLGSPECSLFNPKDFEKHIESMARQEHQDKDSFFHGNATWALPINWKTVNSTGIPSVSYEEQPVYGGERSRVILTPISHDRYLQVSFNFYKDIAGSFKDAEAMIDSTEMNALADNIVSSIHIELSAAAKAERKSILDQFPDQKLSSYVPPYKFTTPEQDEQWKRYRKIIEDAQKITK